MDGPEPGAPHPSGGATDARAGTSSGPEASGGASTGPTNGSTSGPRNGRRPYRPNGSAGDTASGPTGPSVLRREILIRLRRDGPASPDHLATALQASRTGVLQQLRALESAELVSRQTVRHGVGRPRHVYDVTPAAQELFPSNYHGLAAGLLNAIADLGGEDLLEQVFTARRRQIAGRIRAVLDDRLGPAAPLAERVRFVAVFQDEQGYLCRADVDGDGAVRLVEHNCAIHDVAVAHPAACRAELELFREVLGADVVRESHIAAGARCCAYRITEPAAAEPIAAEPVAASLD